jgi:multiple sugar transport system permease protein
MASRIKFRLLSILQTTVRRLFLLIAILFVLIPFLYFISVSFQPKNYAQTLVPNLFFKPTLENYYKVFSTLKFFQYFGNSIIICALSTAISLVIGSLAAYTISRVRNKFVDQVAFWILTQRMLPAIAVLIPMYLVMSRLALLDTFPGMIIVYAVLNLPYVVWMSKSFFDDIPIELDESAMLDGCTKPKIIFGIVYPIAKPGLFATGVFVFVLSWSEFIFALILSSMNTKTLPVAISSFVTDTGIEWNSMAAAGSVLIIPLAVMFFFIQKSLIKGLSFGAVKG